MELQDHLTPRHQDTKVPITDSPGPNLEAQDARQILGLLDRSLDMYRAMGAQGDALYGQALSRTLFTRRTVFRRPLYNVISSEQGSCGSYLDQKERPPSSAGEAVQV